MRVSIPFVILLLLCGAWSCADNSGVQPPSKQRVLRVVSLEPSNTEIVCALGACGELVAVTSDDNYPPSVKSLPKVGSFGSIDLERVVAVQPQLVLAGLGEAARVAPALKSLGIPVLIVEPTDLDGIYRSILQIGAALGRKSAADALVGEIRQQVATVVAKVSGLPKRRVFWELSSSLWTAGPGSYIDELIALAGGVNIAASAGAPWLQLSDEEVIAKNPQVIFLADEGFGANPATIAQRPGWASLRAVRDGRVIPVSNIDLVSRPGPRVAQALRYIAEEIHPEAFR